MIKYIGSKRALIPWITQVIRRVDEVEPLDKVADLFSGTSRVGHPLKQHGFEVIGNDHAAFAHVLAETLVAADRDEYPPERIEPTLADLMGLEPRRGFITENYAEQAQFFQPKNARRIDAIRPAIDDVATGDATLRAILMTSLMLAADRVDSTTGVQMAYLKTWAKRSYNDLELVYPPLVPGTGHAIKGDALDVAPTLDVDLVYMDPPYNQHKGNYAPDAHAGGDASEHSVEVTSGANRLK